LETIKEDLEKSKRRGWKTIIEKVIIYIVIGKEESI
jgi:hypothetical protein